MNFTERLLPEFDTEMTNTRKILEVVPEDKFSWKPHDKSMSLGALAAHISDLPDWALHSVQVDTLEIPADYKAFAPATREELLRHFDEGVAKARPMLAGVAEPQLDVIWRLKFDGKTFLEMPRGKVLRSTVMNHLIHHRGQLTVYLRLLGVPVPGMYGPSADEMSAYA